MKLPKIDFIPNLDSDSLVESFLVAAISTILIIRFILHFTGYPQLGGDGLHISHVLLGGLGMLIAIILLLNFLNRPVTNLAAIIGGAGFGAFVDELGKFITQDNNYFFEPTIAIVYIIFIILYLVFRMLDKQENISPSYYLVNCLEIVKDAVIEGLDIEQFHTIKRYLRKCDPADSTVQSIQTLISKLEIIPTHKNIFTKINQKIREIYHKISRKALFRIAIIAFFVIQSLISLYHNTIDTDLISKYIFPVKYFTQAPSQSFIKSGQIFSSVLADIFVIIGILRIVKSKLGAYQMFKISVLISIFLTQLFTFYYLQLDAIFALIFNLILLAILNTMIYQEKILKKEINDAELSI